jgi:V/A-type H+-transporting ATPase subunit E
MAEELQSLLDRIQRDGVQKATEEKEQMLQAARKEAEAIVRQAEERAAEVRKQAEGDAALTERRAHAAIRQGSRDILLALREELQQRLRTVVGACVGEAMTPERMGQLILAMQKAYLERPGSGDVALDVMLSAKDLAPLEALCRGALAKDLKTQPRLMLGHDLGGGLKLASKDQDLFFDFTDEAITDLVCAYVGPRLAALLRDEKR